MALDSVFVFRCLPFDGNPFRSPHCRFSSVLVLLSLSHTHTCCTLCRKRKRCKTHDSAEAKTGISGIEQKSPDENAHESIVTGGRPPLVTCNSRFIGSRTNGCCQLPSAFRFFSFSLLLLWLLLRFLSFFFSFSPSRFPGYLCSCHTHTHPEPGVIVIDSGYGEMWLSRSPRSP